MLKFKNIEIDLLTDYHMYLFIERRMRGVISNCIKRHAKANNPYLNICNKKLPNFFLVFTDANSCTLRPWNNQCLIIILNG